ncbi:hypothetical protein CQW23_11836 [Capsicum baccatum]|uniref:Hyccin n=1 Tax=Capsicum baccatum TaxID=33114 RepID=A0A2G2WQU6_CAPBA|nr:hypothetical protein CQW23_11836 [Capsicum baccatum]PHU23957.1 hypothetical protein BC332_09064 [Capsicum chinense]
MDFQLNSQISGDSLSSSASSTVQTPSTSNHHQNGGAPINNSDPMHSWWESISKARSRIHLLSSLLPSSAGDASLSALADSDRPARSLLLSPAAYFSISSSLSSPSSGAGDDPLCHWLYDTFLSSDTDLRLVVLSFIPLLSSIYLSRIHSSTSTSLSGFEAVLLSLYAAETKSRGGKPILISIPDLSQPSLYHCPKNPTPAKSNSSSSNAQNRRALVGVLSPPLEYQIAVKSTKRACIVGVALDCYYKQISHMPSWSKLDFCKFAADWGGQYCSCVSEFDETDGNSENSVEISNGDLEGVSKAVENLGIEDGYDELKPKGARIPLPWALLQPVIRILGHCLLGPLNAEDVKDAASVAVKCLYARASHELNPQAILATRSLIQLDKRGREAAAKVAAAATVGSNATTPNKAKKPEILLVSK